MTKEAAADGAASNNLADPSFSDEVITWQKQHGRHALPWQNTRDAYRVWLSEIMLQQTQVAAVTPYYQRFLQRFPDVETLAAAPSEEVMSHWSGLGYYTRARNLHQCAKRVLAEFGGRFPDDPALLIELPGIGRSTAAAIAAFSYGTRAAILDGNVKRVFARVFGVDRYPGEKKVENQLWELANALLPRTDIEAYTQGLMDLGATVCVRSRPACNRCPLATRCIALATGRVEELPVRKPRKVVPEKEIAMLVITDGDAVLLERRPDSGIWGGLLSLPEMALPTLSDLPHVEQGIGQIAHCFGRIEAIEPLARFSHGFTHYKLHVTPFCVRLKQRVALAGQARYQWIGFDEIEGAPLPAPVKRLLSALFAAPDLLSPL